MRIVFGSPTYVGGEPWRFKKFADTPSKAARPSDASADEMVQGDPEAARRQFGQRVAQASAKFTHA